MQTFKILLIAQTASAVIAAHRRHARQRFHHGVAGPQIWGEAGDLRMEAMRQDRTGIRKAEDRQLLHGAFAFRQLILAAKRHEDAGFSDGCIEHLGQTDLAGDILFAQVVQQCGAGPGQTDRFRPLPR